MNTPAAAREMAGESGALAVEIVGEVAVLTLDRPGSPVNTLGPALATELSALLDRFERDARVGAIVLRSGKPDMFIAGADIEQFLAIRSSAEAASMSRNAQAIMDRIEHARTPVVAAIHGACLGGGLETALACAYRIATDHPKTILALPEVQLGLIPGAGGTQRLPATVGLRAALEMILTGKNVRARKAYRTGLVDELVHPEILGDVALDRARQLAAGTLARSRGHRARGPAGLALEGNPIGRGIVLRQARERTVARTHGHYPAPLAAIQAVAAGVTGGRERGLATEARLFGDMAVTDVSRQLIFLFFATTALKKDRGVDAPVDPLPVDRLGVLGAGFMGAGIAAVAAMHDTTVRLKDTSTERVAKGLAVVYGTLREQLVKKQITRRELDDERLLVGGTTDYSGFGSLDLVIEAVFEDLALKQTVLRETERALPGDAIYATNTSTIPIARIAEASERPEQVLGMHFFSPVPKMPLLEVVVTPRTTAVATATAVAYGKKLGKHVIVVRDGPGFYTTRTLSAYMNEAGFLLDEGVRIDFLDRALVDWGFPVGPVTLLDEVGIDVGGKVGAVLHDALGERMAPAQSLARVAAAGRTGRKGGSGFYRYEPAKRGGGAGKKGAVDETIYALLPAGMTRIDIPPADLQQRCVLAMVNEAARCLGEGILRSARDGDVGAVFGIGFPPFRGGPFRYLDSMGIATAVRQLEAFQARFGDRYEPAPVLSEMARKGERFYQGSRG